MPALTAFGRRWQAGSDDFVFPGLLDTCVKTCWLLATLVVVLAQNETYSSPNGAQLRMYLYGLMASLLVIIVADMTAVRCSMRGSIMNADSRKLLVPLIYVRVILEAVDTAWNTLGTLWAFGETFSDFETEIPGTMHFIRRFIICNWISLVVLGLFFAFLYDPFGGKEYSDEVLQTAKSEFWEGRFKRYCCYFGCFEKSGTVRDGFKEVGKVIAFILKDTNFIATDVLAGLFALFQREQQRNKSKPQAVKIVSKAYNVDIHNPSKAVIRNEPTTAMRAATEIDAVVLIDYYFKFVNGSTGWQGFLINNRKERGLSRLWKSAVCCGCWKQPYSTEIEGDNCCFCSMGALKETITDFREADLVYVSFKNDYYEVPFYIILDHQTHTCVIAVRGTYSGKDVITDLTGWPILMNVPGLPETYLAHHGMLLAAKCVYEKMKKLGILQKLKKEYPEYNLVLVGQSLGGGTATLLGLILHAEFPLLRVFAYNPPGGLLSLDAAKWTETFTTSVVYGTDGLARLSLASLEIFRKRVVDAIFDCKTPKYKLLMGAFGALFGYKSKIEFTSDFKSPGNENTAYITSGSEDDESSETRNNLSATDVFKGPMMYLPGRILYVSENPEWSELKDDVGSEVVQSKFEMRWADREEFLEIVISSRLYADHWHFQMLEAFAEYKRNHNSPNVTNENTPIEV